MKQLQTQLKATETAAVGTSKAFPQLGNSSNQATFALTNFSRVVQDAPFGIIGIANNIDPLIQSFTALRASTGSTSAALSALGTSLLGPAGIAIAISAVTTGLVLYEQSQRGANKQTKESVDLFAQAADNYSKTAVEATILVNALKSGELTLEQTRKAQNELIRISPDFKEAFSGPVTDVEKLDKALKNLTARLLNNIKATVAQNILNKEFEKLATSLVQRRTFESQFPNLQNLDTVGAFKPLRDKYNKETQNLEFDIKNFGERINQVFKFLDVQYGNFIDGLTGGTGGASKQIETESTKIKNVVQSLNVGLDEAVNFTKELVLQFANLKNASLGINDAIPNFDKLIQKQKEFIASGLPERATRTSPILITEEQYSKQIEILDKFAQKQREIQEIQALGRNLIQGLTADFVNVFSTVSNDGRSAFERLGEAIEETTKRIIAQFIATKALTFLLNTLFPGSGIAAGGQDSIEGVLRGDRVRLLVGRG